MLQRIFGPGKLAVLAIATVVIGNRGYRQNGSSFGCTLLKVRHGVAVRGDGFALLGVTGLCRSEIFARSNSLPSLVT